jgi:predicted alpha/beta-fold hydrolase
MSVMIKVSNFIPGKGMRNAHIQSMLPTLMRTRLKFTTVRERLDLPDGDFIDLEWIGEGNGPIVALFHGLAGSSDSPYIKGMMQAILDNNWRGVLMYYRGCSGTPNRLTKTYHLGQSEDIDFFSKTLHMRFPNTPLFAIGFSMGGNLLLKWLGENPEQHIYQATVAISPPFDLRAASHAIRKGRGWLYQWVLLRNLRQYLLDKYQYQKSPVDVELLGEIKSFWDLDEKITAPINGFKNATEYYRQAGCGRVLQYITTPTLIIHSKDDPLIPTNTIPHEEMLSPQVTLELSEHGGHVGFVAGSLQTPIFWAEDRAQQFFHSFLGSSWIDPSSFDDSYFDDE